eukprot:CAMPEP_0203683498 /NCGR_PEP_ID=MMETSP0090-20130426/47553_1 /ASSEMBLY_ACC=CAM_ASM_001088 /TAXON_ID=426623 /ORGANISM="Chaetoceros affinis, Strain CCMP159" /LENGTH=968 /DNA_ID=CAMNT_0050552645 /DNA_START=1683 /DNA_END=4589 /DNA_ORIENTATION=-
MMEERVNGGDLTNNIVHMDVPFGKPIEEVYEGVHDGPVLGSGISGLVRLCTHRATGARYAVKCLDLGLVESEEGLQQLREEIAIMCQLDHPNIVRLEEVYESHSEIYLVQELCVGGELFDRLDEQPDYHYSEAQCARLVKQMLCSVRYIHSKGIIHRDLKLENFLFSNDSPDSELKMIDFGLSKHFQYGEVHHEAVGTPYTVAPEVIRGSYDERCDVWAIGVIAYLLLSGDPPFGGCGGPESLFQVRSNILQGKFEFEPAEVWNNVSEDAKDFIRTMLVTDPIGRPTAKICQRSKWIQEWANKDKVNRDTKLDTNVVKALVNFKEYSDMRKLLCEVLSFTLMPDQITDLRKEFEKLDTDGSGEISLNGLKRVLMQGAGAGSLGALTEEEIVDIFNAMRVRKTETRIHWHEFIAAGLSQCKVDERNLRLAFDRLDSDHKGYITFDNVMDLMGRDGAESEDEMRAMWSDSMRACNSKNAQITYDDFLLLMKGQTRVVEHPHHPHLCELNMSVNQHQHLPSKMPSMVQQGGLDVLHECTSISESTDEGEDSGRGFFPIVGTSLPSPHLLPVVGADDDMMDAPLTMDEDDNFDQKLSDSADAVMRLKQEVQSIALATPPQSPCPCPPSPTTSSLLGSTAISPLADFTRRRSKSVDDQDIVDGSVDLELKDHIHFNCDIRRAMPLPEHTHDTKEIEEVIHDETLTPLVVNRQLYRAHRKMRLAVLEASKRFEDQQMERAKAELQAQQQRKDESSSRFGAGLVMRRGHKKEVSSETIRSLMMQREKEHETVINDAARKSGRTGRGRRARKKTVSDMSGMMSAINPEELKMQIDTNDDNSSKPLDFKPELPRAMSEKQPELLLHDITKPEPTVPGVFRKTSDPFSTMQNIIGLFGTNSNINDNNTNNHKSDKIMNNLGDKTGSHALNMSKSSSLKLSLSDGELNTLNDAPNSPEALRPVEDMLSCIPPPPLSLDD